MIQRHAADGFEIAVEHGVDDRGANALAGEIGKRARTASAPRGSVADRTSPTLVLLWRASTRTRLESCIGLSG
jgi:hypothetical protein